MPAITNAAGHFLHKVVYDASTTSNETTSASSDGSVPSYAAGDLGFILFSTSLVFLMIPAVGYFYSGLARSKNALSLMMLSCMSVAITLVQWFCFGYSFVFSKSSTSGLIGNFDNAFLRHIMADPSIGSAKIPDILFCIYQGMFAAITPALAVGAAAERGRLIPTAVFVLLWTTVVYDFIAYWTWNPMGWAFKLESLDFAGGLPVHISSGVAALAYAQAVGIRQGFAFGRSSGGEKNVPHNMSNVVLGTSLLWFGWFGFNGGSALAANVRAVMACVVSCLSAATAGLTWVLLDFRYEKKLSMLGFCSGVIAGLVGITPAAGFVSPASSIAIGFVSGLCCHYAIHLKHVLRYDDALDVFAVHGVGGLVGSILTGVFAQQSIAALDGVTVIKGGWLDGHWMQVPYQLAASFAGMGWSFVATHAILFLMDHIPGVSIRASEDAELLGLDLAELGETAYLALPHIEHNGTSFAGQEGEEASKTVISDYGSSIGFEPISKEAGSQQMQNRAGRSRASSIIAGDMGDGSDAISLASFRRVVVAHDDPSSGPSSR
ncbi:ammonium transporter [Ramicandelaber brevisporus]|nr:ammonium transporter [Ramicandelaber brevisporus]